METWCFLGSLFSLPHNKADVYVCASLKSNIDVFFCDVISLLSQIFIVSSNRVSKEVSMSQLL